MRPPVLDQRDKDLIDDRMAAMDADPNPREGDFVEFADGVVRRISHVYGPDWGDMAGVQTSDGGSWYLGHGYCSFSGSLHPAVKMATLTLTTEQRRGSVWVFHHDWHTAHNGVEDSVEFRVYKCSEVAPR